MEFTLSEDSRKNFSEILEAIQEHQIAQIRELSQMQKRLESISTDTYGVTFEHGELANILCCMATDLSVCRAMLGILVEHPVESVEEEDT